ncbi:helicase-related protein [Cellulosilyticum sp. I15G10I2]|uniref:helicase-related protein n=1 Tax=Cellulosilyticum sp. I15G10I2 TaxID=1892843 RepID=UPI00085C0A56|nr:helicase-related protein [Cellulosilyticum sp. I15G10I2]
MKKNHKQQREFKVLSDQLVQIKEIVNNTKAANLWSHEAALRKKIKSLMQIKDKHLKDFHEVYTAYKELLDDVSLRLLEDYNERNETNYTFEDIIKGQEAHYLNSGIIAVLMTSHIPALVADEFRRYFPQNPKDEYQAARTLKRKIYLHLGETNTGKTYNAICRLKESKKGVYLAPLRILALEIFERLNKQGIKCSLRTGEEEVLIEDACHVSSTVEKLNLNEDYDVAVIDEIQMIGDAQRGAAWTRAVLGLRCKEIHICGAFNAKALLLKIIKDCDDDYEIKEYVRNTPLVVMDKSFHLKAIEKGDALVVFSKKRVLELAKYYLEQGIKASIIYGDLPPEVRRMQYQAFINGENSILIATDAIGMGVNLPIRRILFMNIKKFDGDEVRFLTSQEVKQIAGRAGRKGIYDTGYAGSIGNNRFIKENLEIPDDWIYEAVVGPSEALLKITQLPLREKLALWSTREESLNYFRKMDVRDYLLILDHIKKYKLKESDQWKLMKLPFDVEQEELLQCLLHYTKEYFIKRKDVLCKPHLIEEHLEALEVYYQKINLYYSFSKNFGLDFDEQWVYESRSKISEKINTLLIKL